MITLTSVYSNQHKEMEHITSARQTARQLSMNNQFWVVRDTSASIIEVYYSGMRFTTDEGQLLIDA